MIRFPPVENPFQFGRELGVDELVDRQEEITGVIRTIRNGEKLFLIGPRRFGKTSILKAASDRATRSGSVVLRYNAEGYPSLDQLVKAIVAEAAKSLPGGVERIGSQVKKFFSGLRPELSFNVTESSWTVKLGAASADREGAHVDLLVDALNGLEKMATEPSRKRSVGLIIDEFQKAIEIGGENTEEQIRAAVQAHKSIGYVFAGSKTRMLTSMTADASRPFYRLGSVMFVGALPRAEFAQFLVEKFTRGGFKVEDATIKQSDAGAAAEILNLAEEVPYNVQMLAHACWEELSGASRARPVLTRNVVNNSLERVVRQYDPFYTQIWNQLTPVQQKTLLALVKMGGVNMQSVSVVHAVGKGASTISKSLAALLAKDLIREEETKGNIRVRFEDPFFGRWIQSFVAELK